MTYVDDPDYKQIRKEFLEYVRRFHEVRDYSSDWQGICQKLGIKVTAATSNQYTMFQGQSLISIDAAAVKNRQTFTGLHELSHYLFKTADEGFRSLLEDKYSKELAKAIEEGLCHEAAGILLVPDQALESAVAKHGYHPKVAFELSERMGSLAACLTRLLLSHDVEAWGIIVRRDSIVEFSCTNTRFPLWKDHCIEDSHAIHQAWHGAIELSAPLPYASGDRKVKRLMRASSNERRVIALFAREFPVISGDEQISLFALV